MNNSSTDFYMKHGNTLSPNSPFSSFKATCEYIETSIVSNIISSLEKNEGIRSYPPSLEAVYECASGKILENFVITDIYKMLSEASSKWYVSKFNHTIKGKFEEVDLIILNKQTKDVFLFEIKHSSQIDDRQTRHLESEKFISYIEDNFGPVKERIVLYNGVMNQSEKIKRINIADFLTHMYKNYRNLEYSIENSIKSKLETKTISKKRLQFTKGSRESPF